MLTGTLDDFTLPDIFRLLSQSRKSGRLDVQRSAGRGNVYFRDGDVYFAESTISKELIGQKLVRAKVVTDGQLMKALDEQAEGGGRLGDILREGGLVSDDQLQAAVRSQIEDAVFDLLRWDAGQFDWAPGESVDTEVPLSVSVENLIMEGSRRLDELAIITRKIPSENAVVEMAPTPPEGAAEINITPNEWRILVLVNGQRSVLDIAETVGSDVFATMRTLYGLAAAGLVHVPGHVDDDDRPLPPLPSEQAAPAPETAPVAQEPPVVDEPEPATEPPVVDEPEPATEPTEIAPQDDTDTDAVDSLEAVDIAGIAEISDATPAVDTSAYHASAYDPDLDAVAEDVPADDPSAPEESDDDTSLAATDLPTGEWFDAPQPGDLIEETPSADAEGDADPFVSEILGPETTGDVTPVAEDLDDSFLTAADGDSDVAPGGDQGSEEVVDKRAAVQELSDLFKQSEVENTPTFLVPRPTADTEGDDHAIETAEPQTKHRIEDDEEITRGLISRLIDGVKGL